MKKSLTNGNIAALAALLWLTGCGQNADPVAVEPAVASTPSQPKSFARSAVDAGGVEHIKVQASGTGKNIQVAIDRAIRLAYEQVNGKSFNAATASLESEFNARLGEMSLDGSVSGYSDAIFTATQGSVSEFRIVSQSDTDQGVMVLIEASVEKYVRPESASQLRIAFSPLRSDKSSFSIGGASVPAATVSKRINDAISDTLLESKRVTVLNREFDAEINRELARIDTDNWKNEDRLRLGQQLATDFLVVGRIDRFEYTKQSRSMRTSDKVITSWSGGASMKYQVVNVATGQVQISDTVKIELPQTKPTTMGASVNADKVVADLVANLTESASKKITLSLFPITVVDVDGDVLVLSQGGDAVQVHNEYEIVLRGKEIRDPQTGQVIGRVERACCTIKVTNVTAEMSYGVIGSKQVADVAAVFAPGALELRGIVTTSVAAASVPPRQAVAESKPAPAKTAQNATATKAIPEAEDDSDW